jgi:nucleoside-diphosphate-sugar epimerase
MNEQETDHPPQRILITGAGGFIGRAVVDTLSDGGNTTIHALGRSLTSPLGPEITYHRVDLLNPDELNAVFERVRPTHLIHLAWCSEHNLYWRDHKNLAWIDANLRIAQAFTRNGGTRCLFAGTSAEYDWGASAPFHEFQTPLKPQLLYGASKLACYHALAAFFEQEGVSWSWGRFFCPFGQHEDRRRLIPKTCLRLLAGEQLDFDSARDLRDFMHVEDIAAALCAVLNSNLQGPVNVASGQAVTVREVITLIAHHLEREGSVNFKDENPGNEIFPSAIFADVTRLATEAGWAPSATLSARLKQTCDWWKTSK